MTEKVSADWTREEAWAAQERFWEMEGADAPGGPLREWNALRLLARIEQDFIAGHPRALFIAIRTCARFGVAMPPWAATAFLARMNAIDSMQASSWDEAFGSPWPKGKHLKTAREGLSIKYPIYMRIMEEHDKADNNGKKTPIDDLLFERIGKEFDVNRSRCRELYAGMANMIDPSRADRKRRARKK